VRTLLQVTISTPLRCFWKNLAKRLHAPSSGKATQLILTAASMALILVMASGQAVCKEAAHVLVKKYLP